MLVGKTVTGMADMMNFPKRWEDFLHDYEFEDARRIYTNGSRLIPSFRVKQMMEHYAPVRHGRWLHTEEPLGWKDVDCMECSACHDSWIIEEDYCFDDMPIWNYCPSCGAKMDGGED